MTSLLLICLNKMTQNMLEFAGQTDASGAPHSTPPPPAPIPGDATNIENVPESSGTSTREKKNRRKRAAVNPNFGKKPKKIKLDEETKPTICSNCWLPCLI